MAPQRTAEGTRYPCPACGFLVFKEPPGSYEMCPVCSWEDCAVQLSHPASPVGPNGPLVDEQRSVLERLPLDVREYAGHHRDPEWRPLTEDEIARSAGGPETGLDYFHAIPENDAGDALYYWRRQPPPTVDQ